MKLNNLPNLRVEDFKGEESWIGRLFVQMNPFFQSVNQVLTQNIEYTNNIKSVVKDYTITAFLPFSFQWPYSDTPVNLQIVRAFKGTALTPTILLAAWEYNATSAVISVSRMVEITDTPGIAALSGRYQFSVRVTV